MALRRPVFLGYCCLVFFFFFLFPCMKTAPDSTFNPIDALLINCGSISNGTCDEGRVWQGDMASHRFLVSSSANSSVATASSQRPGLSYVPFMTARIFTGCVTYSIRVTALERKFLRLYFYPSNYGGRNASSALFHVQVGDHKLLRDFNPAWNAEALNQTYIFREYSLNVTDSGFVNLTFTPSARYPGSYAFVNGIEVISMPDIFTSKIPLPVVGLGTTFKYTSSTALETIYRLNVGGMAVKRTSDSGFFRQWDEDNMYIMGATSGLCGSIDSNITLRYPQATPRYIAPEEVYATQRSMTGDAAINFQMNLTWLLTVDPGFQYLVRLHFCDIQSIYNKPNLQVFSIFINNMTATDQADVYAWATKLLGGSAQEGSALGVPFYKDYITYLPDGNQQVDLWIDLHPNDFTKPEYIDAWLNGIEVFKLNNVHKFNDVIDSNLAGLPATKSASIQVDRNSSPNRLTNHQINARPVIGGVVGGFILISVVAIFSFVLYRKKRQRAPIPSPEKCSTLASNACRRFTFTEIEDATQGFSEKLVIGVGGFGKVYKGMIYPSTSMTTSATRIEVAIKRAHPTSQQGIQEFLNEVEMLSKLRHRHLVSLFGFCDDQGEMILVYEYLANGTLREHLYNNSGKPTLNWLQRLQICTDAARGLHYLHTGVRHTIIHRDVKSTNILLDDAWVVKVADFGLCKVGPEIERRNIVLSTAVKGSFGYLDPDYFRRQKLTDKSDVYSFGVVLLEVLCSRPAVNIELPHEQVCLVEWARYCYDKDLLETIVDQNLKEQIVPECYLKFIDIAYKCIADRGIDRPSMGDVLWSLESAMELQHGCEKELHSSTTSSNLVELPVVDFDGFTSNVDVFSDIVEPRGR